MRLQLVVVVVNLVEAVLNVCVRVHLAEQVHLLRQLNPIVMILKVLVELVAGCCLRLQVNMLVLAV